MKISPTVGAAIVIALLCGGYTAAATVIRPSLLPDAAYGLLVDKSMRQGAPWNHMREPLAGDIARDRTYFYAIWSPGQYAVPGVLISAGMPTGVSVALVSIAASLLGLAGWHVLFRRLGYHAVVAAAACAVIACSRSFNYSFVAYVGSDVLAFGAFPWIALALLSLNGSPWLAPGAAAAMVAAFFVKNSLPIYVGAWVAAQSLVAFRSGGTNQRRLFVAVAPVAAAAIAMAAVHWAYNSRGWTPVAYEPAMSTAAHTYLLPWAMPILAATSWDDVLSWVFSHPSGALVEFDYKRSALLLAAIAAVTAGTAWYALRRSIPATIPLLCAFSAMVLGAFTLLLSTGSGASLDLSRHYRIVGYLWLPLLLQLVAASRPVMAMTLAAAMTVPCAYGVASFAANWRRHFEHRASRSPRLQVTHLPLTARDVRALTALDAGLPDGSLVVAPAAAYALEFRRTRALATSVVSDPIELIRATPRQGTVANLLVIAERPGMSEEKQRAWIGAFVSYDTWEAADVDNLRIYVPAQQPVNAAWLRQRFDGREN
jgi:hypothetical protein